MNFADVSLSDRANALIAIRVFDWQVYDLEPTEWREVRSSELQVVLPSGIQEGVFPFVKLSQKEIYDANLADTNSVQHWNRDIPRYSSSLSKTWAVVNEFKKSFDPDDVQSFEESFKENLPKLIGQAEEVVALHICSLILNELRENIRVIL